MRAVCVTVRDPFHPLQHRQVSELRRRRRVRALAPKTNQPHICLLNGRALLRAEWGRRVQDGDTLAFVMLPQGGGGGSNPLRMVLLLAVAMYAPYIAGKLVGEMVLAGTMGSMGLSLVTAGVTMVGATLVNVLIPPPRPPSSQAATGLAAASPTYTVGAQGNQARLGQPIPAVYGRHVVYPDFAAMPYTEFAGNDQYLYQLFAIGQGEYDVEQIRIEDTAIASFDEVETQIVAPGGTVTLFPTRVISSVEVSGQELEYNVAAGPFVANDAGTVANELAFDIVLPRGLYHVAGSGQLEERTVTFTIEARTVDDAGTPTGSWAVLGNESVSAKTTTPIRNSYRYAVSQARYECRVTRTSVKVVDTSTGNDLAFGGLRAYLPGSQQYGDITMLAMRIRATDNISSQASRKVNVIVNRKLPTWTGTAWTAPVVTRNPAWALADIARAAYGGELADARINLVALKTLADTADARGDTFDAVFDSFSTVWEAATLAARTVRAKPFIQGGNLQVFRDEPAALPVAMFSPRNIVRNSLRLTYKMPNEDMSDAIDVEYFDAGTWAWRKVRAALPGSVQAQPYTFRLYGVTNRAQAWREGMYMAASNKYRRRMVAFQTEMDGFIPTLGDLIAITHDMPRWGQFAEAVAFDSTTRLLTVTEPLDFSAGGTHYLALRKRDGSVAGPYVANATSNPLVVDLVDWVLGTDPVPDVGQDRERTHVAFGPVDATYIKARVLAVKPRGVETAEVEAVVESEFVHTADTGAVPGANAWQLPTRFTYPTVTGLTARSYPGDVNQMILSWTPAAGADRYLIEQSADGTTWTRTGEVSANSYTARALYGAVTLIRVAAVGLTRGPWAQAAYASGADFMWLTDGTLMWDADPNTPMWSI